MHDLGEAIKKRILGEGRAKEQKGENKLEKPKGLMDQYCTSCQGKYKEIWKDRK